MKILTITAFAISVIALGWIGWFVLRGNQTCSKVCIVRMSAIMERYQGAIDASAQLQRKQSAVQENVDSLIRAAGAGADASSIRASQEDVQRYIQAVERRAEEEQAVLSKRLMSHVKSAAETVAGEMDLDLVLAITDEAFVLSRSEVIDVTDEVLRELKRGYRDEFKK